MIAARHRQQTWIKCNKLGSDEELLSLVGSFSRQGRETILSSLSHGILDNALADNTIIHPSKTTMAIRLPRMVSSKKVPKGYFAVYVGESQKRLVIPVSFLNHPSFQDLLGKSEEEFGYSHPTGGLTIPCNEDTFLEVTSRMY
ncbi:hypothetical protein Gotur_024092 [Gossypium turneri]